MMVQGMLIGAALLVLSLLLMGPFGGGLVGVITFGMVFSIFHSNRRIEEDLRAIRGELGLLSEEEKDQLERNNNIEEHKKYEREPEFRSKLDHEIEEELERVRDDKDKKDQDDDDTRGR